MVFCNWDYGDLSFIAEDVTILILIDGFLQYKNSLSLQDFNCSHNPYFNRWFSAISNNQNHLQKKQSVTILILIDGFLQ